MKGFIPVTIPTKTYVKAYILSLHGPYPIMTKFDKIGSKFFDLLEHSTNADRFDCSSRYNDTITLYIPKYIFRIRGANINETNTRNFNLFVEKEVKDKFIFMMDTYIEILPSFTAHLPTIRKRLGIDIEQWSDDSIKKAYYRYRISAKKSLIYQKTFSVSVPSERAENLAF